MPPAGSIVVRDSSPRWSELHGKQVSKAGVGECDELIVQVSCASDRATLRREVDADAMRMTITFSQLGNARRANADVTVESRDPAVSTEWQIAAGPDWEPVTYTAWVSVPAGADEATIELEAWTAGSTITIERCVVEHEVAPEVLRRMMSRDSGSVAFLEAVDEWGRQRGELTLRTCALSRLFEATEDRRYLQSAEAVSSIMSELAEGWRPKVPLKPNRNQAAMAEAERVIGRVCHLHKVAYPHEHSGGAIRNRYIAKEQKRLGYDPYVVTPLFYPGTSPYFCGLTTRTQDDVEYYEFDWPPPEHTRADRRRLLDYETSIACDLIGRRGADLIHAASGTRGYELALKGKGIADGLGIPLVYEVRSLHEHTWGEAFEGSLAAEHTQLRMLKENECMRFADRVVTISESMKRLLVERGIDDEKIDVVPNGVDTDLVCFDDSGAEQVRREIGGEGAYVVGCVSNMSRREGHDVLVDAIDRMTRRGVPVVGLFVGDGPSREELERRAASLGIAEHAVFIGNVDHSEVSRYYQAMDVFVVPRRSDYASDYVTPLKPYEAMANGVAVVASDRPVLLELLGHGRRGEVFSTESAEALTEILVRLYEQPGRRAELAASGRSWVLEERSWSKMCERYGEIYEKASACARERIEKGG